MPPSTSSNSANTDPQGHLLTAIPFGFYPETRMARRPRARRERARDRAAPAAAAARRPAAHQPLYYLDRRPTGRRPTSPPERREGEPLNLYDVSGLAHYELVRAIARAGRPGRLAVSEAQLIGDLAQAARTAVAQAAQRPVRLRLPVGHRRHRLTRRRAVGDGLRVRKLTGETTLRRGAERWLATYSARTRGARRSSSATAPLPRLPPAPGRQHRRLARRLAAGARGRGRRGAGDETSRGRLAACAAAPPTGGDAFARFNSAAVYRGQRAVVHHDRARDRPDGVLDAGVRLAERPTVRTRARACERRGSSAWPPGRRGRCGCRCRGRGRGGEHERRHGRPAMGDHVAAVEIHRPPANYFDAALIRRAGRRLRAARRRHRSAARSCCARRASTSARAPTSARRPARLTSPAPCTGGAAAVRERDAGGGRGPGRGRRRRPRARAVGGLPGRLAGLALQRQLRPARLPPRLRPQRHAAGARRAADGAGPAAHGPPGAGRGGPVAGAVRSPRRQRRGPPGAHALAAELALSAPLAVRSIRATLRAGLVERVEAALEREASEQDRLRATEDFREGVTASIERRPPRFQGR